MTATSNRRNAEALQNNQGYEPMPFIPRPIGPGETLGVSSDTIRAIHHELAVNGFSVGGTETAGANFGSDTEARLREFQSRYGAPRASNTIIKRIRWN
jgi:peptidoglycan hydrolase-like protein with peptidoglycan-binding domain